MIVTTEELYKNQYDYETLKANIYFVSLLDILKTQKLTIEFCVKYILNTDFQMTKEEETISIDMVIQYQPHILETDLIKSKIIATNKKNKKERIDSFEDFDTFLFTNFQNKKRPNFNR
jgi:hypothetical protein